VRLAIPEEFLPHPSPFPTRSTYPRPSHRPSTVPISRPRSTATARPSTALHDPDANSLRESVSQTGDLSALSDPELNLLIPHLKEYTKSIAASGDYTEAQRIRSLYDSATDALHHRLFDRTKSASPRARLAATQHEQEERWQRELLEFDEETASKITEMRDRHGTAVREFELRWQTDSALRKYRKPSSRLLQLSRMEKFLARLSDFGEAELVRLEARELTAREHALSQALVNRDFHREREELAARQRAEMALLCATQQHRRDILLGQQRANRAVLERRESAVEQRQREPCRKREALLPGAAKPPAARFAETAPVSFEFATVLPPLRPPEKGEQKKL
jgi:hypothetical protein